MGTLCFVGEGKTALIMMKLVLLSLAALSAVQSSSELAKKIHRDITKYNNDVACWGRGNAINLRVAMMHAAEQCASSPSQDLLKPVNPFLAVLTPTNNPFQTLPAAANNPFQTLPASSSPIQTLPQNTRQGFNVQNWNKLWSTVFVQPSTRGKRAASTNGLLETDKPHSSLSNLSSLSSLSSKRAASTNGLLETDEEDFQEFLEDFTDFKQDMTTKMSNLTCVLSKLKMLDSNLQVNLKAYTHDFWNEVDLSQTLAGSDPVWRNMMTAAYQDCYSIAQSWPQETLNKNPITKVFGRHMVFFKCAKKVEAKCCMEAQADEWLSALYGEDPTVNYAQ